METFDPEIFELLLERSRQMAENRDLDTLLPYAMSVALELVGAKRGYLVLAPDLATIPLVISFMLYAPWVWGGAYWLWRRPPALSSSTT